MIQKLARHYNLPLKLKQRLWPGESQRKIDRSMSPEIFKKEQYILILQKIKLKKGRASGRIKSP